MLAAFQLRRLTCKEPGFKAGFLHLPLPSVLGICLLGICPSTGTVGPVLGVLGSGKQKGDEASFRSQEASISMGSHRIPP